LVFRRGGFNGAELVEDDLSFKEANIFNMISIFVEKGTPTRPGWKRLKIYHSVFYNPDWYHYEYAVLNG
jgi:hypothetical protein